MTNFTFAAYSQSTGLPLSGLTPTWATYLNSTTGAAITPQPAIGEYGATGVYFSSVDPIAAGVLDMGVTASPRYAFTGPGYTVPAWNYLGAPLTGLTPVWDGIYNTVGGYPVVPQPTFSEFPGTGIYYITGLTAVMSGIINWFTPTTGTNGSLVTGAGSGNIRLTVGSGTPFSANCVGGILQVSDAASSDNNGSFQIAAFNSATSIDIANGSGTTGDANNGSIHWTLSLANPQFTIRNETPSPTGPAFGTPIPAPLGVLGVTQSVIIPVTDPNVLASQLTFEIIATYLSGGAIITELVYSASLGWSSLYLNSSLATSLPGDITLTRIGGWPSAPTIYAYVADTLGGTAEGSWTWILAQSAPSPVTGTTSTGTSGTYGQDWQTYLDLGNGPDLDPYLRIITNPAIFIPEEMARKLTMPPGTLNWAPGVGYDLRSLINAVSQSIATYKAAIMRQCLTDPRVKSVNVNLTTPAPGVLHVAITGFAANGPFSIIFDLSTIGVSNLTIGG